MKTQWLKVFLCFVSEFGSYIYGRIYFNYRTTGYFEISFSFTFRLSGTSFRNIEMSRKTGSSDLLRHGKLFFRWKIPGDPVAFQHKLPSGYKHRLLGMGKI